MVNESIIHQLRESEQLQFLMQYSEKPEKILVCFIDLVNSTETVSKISPRKIVMFYKIFLNFIAKSVESYNGKVVKNLGDSILFYFVDSEKNDARFFENTIECINNLIQSKDKINSLLVSNSLPKIKYRISADYGDVVFGKSSTSYVDDIIGECVDRCCEMNPFGNAEKLIIGKEFQRQISHSKKYKFTTVAEPSVSRIDMFLLENNTQQYSK